jgi:hypothetical protein
VEPKSDVVAHGSLLPGRATYRQERSRRRRFGFSAAIAGAIDELASIIDYDSPTCSNGPCIDPIFGPSEHIYGSSTTHTLDPFPAYAWIVYPWTGVKYPLPKEFTAFGLRAVRSAH